MFILAASWRTKYNCIHNYMPSCAFASYFVVPYHGWALAIRSDEVYVAWQLETWMMFASSLCC